MLTFDIEKQITWKFDNEISRFSLHYYPEDNTVVYFFSLFVEPKYRKKGLGNAILEYAEKFAKEQDFSTMMLKVEKDTWMERWYCMKGYEFHGEEEDYVWLKKTI